MDGASRRHSLNSGSVHFPAREGLSEKLVLPALFALLRQYLPGHAVQYCLEEAGIGVDDLAHVVCYDKPFLTFERLLLSYLTVAPRGLRSCLQSMPLWLRQKIHVPKVIQKEIGYEGEVL